MREIRLNDNQFEKPTGIPGSDEEEEDAVRDLGTAEKLLRKKRWLQKLFPRCLVLT